MPGRRILEILYAWQMRLKIPICQAYTINTSRMPPNYLPPKNHQNYLHFSDYSVIIKQKKEVLYAHITTSYN